MINLTIYGECKAQSRPRFTTRSGFARAYEKKDTKDYKSLIYHEALKVKPDKPLEGAIRFWVDFYKPIPKATSKKQKELMLKGFVRPITRPDIDNYIKLAQDALNGVIWKDDSQIVEIKANKIYSDNPRMEITIMPFDDIPF